MYVFGGSGGRGAAPAWLKNAAEAAVLSSEGEDDCGSDNQDDDEA
ncbi:MAG: hypothetical protein AB4063_27005 [Crocosphaera sp.]